MVLVTEMVGDTVGVMEMVAVGVVDVKSLTTPDSCVVTPTWPSALYATALMVNKPPVMTSYAVTVCTKGAVPTVPINVE